MAARLTRLEEVKGSLEALLVHVLDDGLLLGANLLGGAADRQQEPRVALHRLLGMPRARDLFVQLSAEGRGNGERGREPADDGQVHVRREQGVDEAAGVPADVGVPKVVSR